MGSENKHQIPSCLTRQVLDGDFDEHSKGVLVRS